MLWNMTHLQISIFNKILSMVGQCKRHSFKHCEPTSFWYLTNISCISHGLYLGLDPIFWTCLVPRNPFYAPHGNRLLLHGHQFSVCRQKKMHWVPRGNPIFPFVWFVWEMDDKGRKPFPLFGGRKSNIGERDVVIPFELDKVNHQIKQIIFWTCNKFVTTYKG